MLSKLKPQKGEYKSFGLAFVKQESEAAAQQREQQNADFRENPNGEDHNPRG